MAKYRGDKYVIERDEREGGGKLVRLATYGDWKEAKAAWQGLPVPDDANVALWFARLNNGHDVKEHCLTLDCKVK